MHKAKGCKDSATINDKIGRSKTCCFWRFESGCSLVTNAINKSHVNKPEDSHHTLNNVIITKGDDGATRNYWHEKEKHMLQNIKPDA